MGDKMNYKWRFRNNQRFKVFFDDDDQELYEELVLSQAEAPNKDFPPVETPEKAANVAEMNTDMEQISNINKVSKGDKSHDYYNEETMPKFFFRCNRNSFEAFKELTKPNASKVLRQLIEDYIKLKQEPEEDEHILDDFGVDEDD